MGEWKAQISVRVAQDFRREFEAFAAKERRNTSNMGFVLLEWAFEQLKCWSASESSLGQAERY